MNYSNRTAVRFKLDKEVSANMLLYTALQVITIGVHKMLFSVGDDAVCSAVSQMAADKIICRNPLVVWPCYGISGYQHTI